MREQLLTRMIQMYGFEHPSIIQFAQMMEDGASDETLQTIVEGHETLGIAFEFEDED